MTARCRFDRSIRQLIFGRMAHGALAVVEDWHAALNDGSVERVRGLSADYVRVLGPRGSGMIAAEELGDWMIHSGFSATPERWFCGADGTVVVEQSARWSHRDTGVEAGRSTVATAFQVNVGTWWRFAVTPS